MFLSIATYLCLASSNPLQPCIAEHLDLCIVEVCMGIEVQERDISSKLLGAAEPLSTSQGDAIP